VSASSCWCADVVLLRAVQGVVPEHFARASGGLIRHILQQLEEIGFVEKNPGSHGGRRITSQVGAPACPGIAAQIADHFT
jgi:ribosomal protein S19E (S16A)